MPISLFLKASGVLVHAGASGRIYTNRGAIDCIAPPVDGFDEHLFAALKIMVDETSTHIEINSTDRGPHAPGSRHFRHLAVDFWKVNAMSLTLEAATVSNPAARRVVRWLAAQGFKHHEMGPWACILLGAPMTAWNETTVPHPGHCHFSLYD